MTTVVEYPEEAYRDVAVGAWPFWSNGTLYVTTVGASIHTTSYALVALPTSEK